MKNILLTIAYDGSRFHGWQRQPEEQTVQGYLEQTFSRLFKQEIRLSGTSRTDAGVHALGQRASFQSDIRIPIQRLARVMNNALCGREEGSFVLSPVRILEAKEMPADFHARFDCKGKKYIYRILPGCGAAAESGTGFPGGVDIFRRNYVYHVQEQLDIGAIREAAQRLEGTQDFKSFESAGGTPRETTVRTIFSAKVIDARTDGSTAPEQWQRPDGSAAPEQWQRPDGPAAPEQAPPVAWPADEIRFEIAGDGFLYNMVRIITGTLVEVGQGKKRPEDITRIIAAKDRSQAGHTAPPYGLYLAEVYYD